MQLQIFSTFVCACCCAAETACGCSKKAHFYCRSRRRHNFSSCRQRRQRCPSNTVHATLRQQEMTGILFAGAEAVKRAVSFPRGSHIDLCSANSLSNFHGGLVCSGECIKCSLDSGGTGLEWDKSLKLKTREMWI